jgi:hypothetical protein
VTFAISRHIFRAIPTFTTRSGYAFINAPIFEVDVASATTTMMSWPASVRRLIAPTALASIDLRPGTCDAMPSSFLLFRSKANEKRK